MKAETLKTQSAAKLDKTEQHLLDMIARCRGHYSFCTGLMRRGSNRYGKLLRTNVRQAKAALSLKKKGLVKMSVEPVAQDGECYRIITLVA